MGVHLETVSGLLAIPLLAATLLTASPPVRTVDVVPGAVVRWEAREGDQCSNGTESWAPLGKACYFGVDLQLAAGALEIALVRGGARETSVLNVLPSPYPDERLTLDKRKVTLSAKDQERARREREEVLPLFDLRGPAQFALPVTAPLRGTPPYRNFGTRRILNGEPRSRHGGADYKAAVGTPVLAVAPGRVALVANHFFSGRSVYVDHGDGLISMSMHLSRVDVKTGQEVRAGDRLGLSGATGRVSGPHLHFGLRWRGATIDPGALIGPGPHLIDLPGGP